MALNVKTNHTISVVHISDLLVHIIYPFLKIVQLFSKIILVFTQVMGIFFDSLKQCLVVIDGLIYCFFVFIQILLVDLSEVIQISIDTFISLFIFKFDIIKKFQVSCDLFIDSFEIGL